MVLSSSSCCHPAKFARMASVEELDSSLTLLTHHPAKSIKSFIKTNSLDDSKASGTNLPSCPTANCPVEPLFGDSAMLTPPGSPYSARTISPNCGRSPTFDYSQQRQEHSQASHSFVDSAEPAEKCVAAAKIISSPTRSAIANATSGPNVVAIDNKIEQAMDLVKTHLTFAVREEVEILRSTIVDLEAKVAQLESQNQLLRQFAPAEIVSSLAFLMQNVQQKQQHIQQAQQIPGVSSAPAVTVFQTPPTAVQPMGAQGAQPVVLQQQTVATGPQVIAPGVLPHVAAMSTQTDSQPQVATTQPSAAAQHGPVLQSTLTQQVTALPQQPPVLQTTLQQQTITPQSPTVIQQTVAAQQLGNVPGTTVPIGNDTLATKSSTFVTNPGTQLQFPDPNGSNPTVM